MVGSQQAAQHLDGGRLARAVRAQQPVDLAITHLHVDVVDRGEIAELLGQIAGSDSDLPAQPRVIAPAGKRRRMHLLAQSAQGGDKHILKCRFVDADIVRCRMPAVAMRPRHGLIRPSGWCTSTIRAGRRSAARRRSRAWPSIGRQHLFGLCQVLGVNFQALGAEALAQFGRRADLPNLAQMHQRDAMAALGFIEIGRSHADGQALGGEMRQRVPEFAARDRIDAGGGSSSSRTRGCGTSAHASASFCFMPPLRRPARRSAKRSMSNI